MNTISDEHQLWILIGLTILLVIAYLFMAVRAQRQRKLSKRAPTPERHTSAGNNRNHKKRRKNRHPQNRQQQKGAA